jgi:hypothetical protein
MRWSKEWVRAVAPTRSLRPHMPPPPLGITKPIPVRRALTRRAKRRMSLDLRGGPGGASTGSSSSLSSTWWAGDSSYSLRFLSTRTSRRGLRRTGRGGVSSNPLSSCDASSYWLPPTSAMSRIRAWTAAASLSPWPLAASCARRMCCQCSFGGVKPSSPHAEQ